ncbi:hypothetical protein EDB19DRAFT_1832126 [Suillus lakei]|nr:hypothetical protein EDB19DRAFT_1832126 [Suillus lakei]
MSSNNSKNSKSSEVLPLNDGALLEFAPGMAFMPLEALDMVFTGWEGAEGVSGGIRGSMGVSGSNTAGLRMKVDWVVIAGKVSWGNVVKDRDSKGLISRLGTDQMDQTWVQGFAQKQFPSWWAPNM